MSRLPPGRCSREDAREAPARSSSPRGGGGAGSTLDPGGAVVCRCALRSPIGQRSRAGAWSGRARGSSWPVPRRPPHPTGPVDIVCADRSCVIPRFASLRSPTTEPTSPVGRGPCSPRCVPPGAERGRRQTHHDHHREDHHHRDQARTRRHGRGRARPGRPTHLDHRDERVRPHRAGPRVPGLDPHPRRAPTRPSLPRHRREPGRAR